MHRGEAPQVEKSVGSWGLGSLRVLLDVAAAHGVSEAECLRGARIPREWLEDPGAEIDSTQELTVVRNLLGSLRDLPALGLDAGSRYRLTTFGIWGYVLLSSASLRSAAEVGVRYVGLVQTFAEVELVGEPGRDVVLSLDDAGIPEDCRAFLIERDMAVTLGLLRALAQRPIRPRAVEFRAARPAKTEAFRDWFGCEPSFGAAANRLVIDAASADSPLPQADAGTRRACEEQCRELLAHRRARSAVAERVRLVLLRPGAPQRVDFVAAQLGLSPRTLRRRLVEEGTTFRTLVGEVRLALATEMLRQGLSVDEIAERLGYAEAASFIHAFKAWTGETPGAYRASL